MGGTESCCGRGEKTKSSSVDRTRGDVEKRNKDRPIENVDIVTKVTKKASSKKKKIRPVKKKNHSVHEGTVPAGLSSLGSTDLGSTDVMMQDSDAEPKQIKPPGRMYLSLSIYLSLFHISPINTSTVQKIYTGKHLNGGNKHLKAPTLKPQTSDSAWVDDNEIPKNLPPPVGSG